jgi:hypothetical protein
VFISRAIPGGWDLTQLLCIIAQVFVAPASRRHFCTDRKSKDRRRDAAATTSCTFYWIGKTSLDANFTRKIFFWSASLFRFAVLEFLLDFRRAHS